MSVIVFTDGGAINNGKKNGKAAIGVFFRIDDPRNKSELLPGQPQTNQRAELYAIIRALQILKNEKKEILVVTDSMYCIKCITMWIKGWVKNNWMTSKKEPVKNKDLLVKALNTIKNLKTKKLSFMHIRSHKLPPTDKTSDEYLLWFGNYQADKLASQKLSVKKN